jgi:hypothetical protein
MLNINEKQLLFLERVNRFKRLKDLSAPEYIVAQVERLILEATLAMSVEDMVGAILALPDFLIAYEKEHGVMNGDQLKFDLDGEKHD